MTLERNGDAIQPKQVPLASQLTNLEIDNLETGCIRLVPHVPMSVYHRDTIHRSFCTRTDNVQIQHPCAIGYYENSEHASVTLYDCIFSRIRCVLRNRKLSSQNMSFNDKGDTLAGRRMKYPGNRLRLRVSLLTWCVSVCVFLCIIPVGFCFNVDIRTNVLHQQDLGSMFGFTVEQYREDGQDWILVGAPGEANTNQTGVDRPGAVYRCPTTRQRCHQIVFDTEGNDYRYNGSDYIQYSNKSHQGFGSTISSSSQHGYILSCAPRYVYFTSTGTKREPLGVCFLYKYNDGRNTITPYYPCKTDVEDKLREVGAGTGLCQAGMSGRVFDADSFIIGAIGSYYWQGQVMIQNISDKADVIETADSQGTEDASYHGYAVAIGYFDGDDLSDLVVSAPRLGNQGGEVKIYIVINRRLRQIKSLTGSGQIGEYFGYCLTVSDFNNDGLDDIVVGAPFYADESSGTYEMGHVYVFYQTPRHTFDRKELEGDQETRARFGTSVSSLGDIDNDGYNDLVVGAPYGGIDYMGAVYIYRGGPRGIVEDHSQKIDGRSISNTLMTFGFSVKAGMDQDRNQYPDIVVGAYDSSETVFLRTRPVVRIHSTMLPSPRRVNLEKYDCKLTNGTAAACFTLQTCLSYDGKGLPFTINVKAKWYLDADRLQEGRVYFLLGSESDRRRKENIITLNLAQTYCNNITVIFKESIQDKLSAIVIRFDYDLELDNPQPDQLQPIMDVFQLRNVNTSVEIEKNCGDDDICIPDLKLALTSATPSYVFGQSEELELSVMVENLGEESYETQLYLTLPPGVTYINIHNVKSKTTVSCTIPDLTEEEILVCNIGNPLPADKTVKFNVRMQPQNISSSTKELSFNAVVNSTNVENVTDTYNNNMNSSIDVAAIIQIITTGVSVPEQVLYNSSAAEIISTVEDVGPEFIHRYVVTNNGPSALSSLDTDIFWPQKLADGSMLFYLTQPPVVMGQGSCNVTLIDLHNLTDMVYKPKEKNGILETAITYMFDDKSEDEDESGEKNFKLTCAKEPETYCTKIHCVTGPLQESESIIIEVHSRVYINSMIQVLEDYRGVIVTSLASATVASLPYSNVILDTAITHNNTVETFVTAIGIGAGTGEVPWWAIALAIVGGAILLMLVVVGLHKCGFFERKKLEDEEDLQENNDEAAPPMEEIASPPSPMEKNGKNGHAKPPPKVQVDPESKNLYKGLPEENF